MQIRGKARRVGVPTKVQYPRLGHNVNGWGGGLGYLFEEGAHVLGDALGVFCPVVKLLVEVVRVRAAEDVVVLVQGQTLGHAAVLPQTAACCLPPSHGASEGS